MNRVSRLALHVGSAPSVLRVEDSMCQLNLRLRGLVLLLVIGMCLQVEVAFAQSLPLDQQKAFQSIPFDPKPDALIRGNHYVVTNEKQHHLYEKDIRGLGGVYLGVGSNQNYDLAAWARSTLVILMDFDQVIVDLHGVYRVAFLSAPTPSAFLKLWSQDGVDLLRDRVAGEFANPEKRKGVLKALRYARKHVYSALTANVRRDRKSGVKSYLTDQNQYDYLVSLFKEGRVFALRGDLTGVNTMSAIAEVLRKNGYVLTIAYVSNAEQYFEFGPSYRANMMGFPVDERSVVLRTRSWKEYAPGTREPTGKSRYTYQIQTFNNLAAWLREATTKDLYDMIPRDRTQGTSVHFTDWPNR